MHFCAPQQKGPEVLSLAFQLQGSGTSGETLTRITSLLSLAAQALTEVAVVEQE